MKFCQYDAGTQGTTRPIAPAICAFIWPNIWLRCIASNNWRTCCSLGGAAMAEPIEPHASITPAATPIHLRMTISLAPKAQTAI